MGHLLTELTGRLVGSLAAPGSLLVATVKVMVEGSIIVAAPCGGGCNYFTVPNTHFIWQENQFVNTIH